MEHCTRNLSKAFRTLSEADYFFNFCYFAKVYPRLNMFRSTLVTEKVALSCEIRANFGRKIVILRSLVSMVFRPSGAERKTNTKPPIFGLALTLNTPPRSHILQNFRVSRFYILVKNLIKFGVSGILSKLKFQ